MRDTAIESSVVTKVKGFGRYANRVMDVSDYVTPPQVRCPTLGTSGESGDRRADLLSQKLQYCWGELDIKKLDFPPTPGPVTSVLSWRAVRRRARGDTRWLGKLCLNASCAPC